LPLTHSLSALQLSPSALPLDDVVLEELAAVVADDVPVALDDVLLDPPVAPIVVEVPSVYSGTVMAQSAQAPTAALQEATIEKALAPIRLSSEHRVALLTHATSWRPWTNLVITVPYGTLAQRNP
jgi:hypothetical protein